MRVGVGRLAQIVSGKHIRADYLEIIGFHLGIWGLSLLTMVVFTRPPPSLFTFYSLLSVISAGATGPPLYYFVMRSRKVRLAPKVNPVSAKSPVQTAVTVKKEVQAKEAGEPKLVEEKGIIMQKIEEKCEVLEEYWIFEPYSKIVIAKLPDFSHKYFVEEIRLNEAEYAAYERISAILATELNPAKIGKEKDIRKEIIEGADRLAKKYKHAFKHIDKKSWDKVLYFLQRDMLGFGPINSIMDDYRVEDISCDGVGSPVFVWHRRFESIPANVIFTDREILDEYIIKLAHKSGKHVSSAYPIVDAMLYGRHRLAASFRDEVSPKGSTFTIRKFREEPLSVTDLIETRTLSPEMAAYIWVLIENKTTVMAMGGTGSGKTTTLNVMASMVKSGMKLVTVEETAEINIPHDNWVQLISRESFGLSGVKIGQISLYDLVRMSLRYRPDYLIVGEIRGEEAFVLFQALATGHGGLSTMHAENLEYAVRRLTSPPMNISESYIPLMNVALLIERTALPSKQEGVTFGRRIRSVWEVVEHGKYIQVAQWLPDRDVYEVNFSQSYYLNKLAQKTGRRRIDMLEEVNRRTKVLKWMLTEGIRSIRDVARVISDYYADPDLVMKKIVEAEETMEKPQVQVKEAAATVEGLRETPNVVLEAVIGEGGSADVETLLKITKLDTISFWNNVETLKRAGYVITGEKSDRGVARTYLLATDRGQSLYRQTRPKE